MAQSSVIAFCPKWANRATMTIMAVVLLASIDFPSSARAGGPPLPFVEVQQLVEGHFAALPDFKEHDLITRGTVDPVLAALHRAGWNVARIEEGVDFYLSDRHALAVQLRTPAGKTLMRNIGGWDNAYDRLARLASFAAGRRLVEKVVQDPNGVEFVKRLCRPEASGLLSQFGAESSLQNFDVPSGRIYTKAAFLDHLRTMHLLESKGLRRPSE